MAKMEKYLARIDRLKLMDDDFFSEALDGKIEAVEFILRVVLGRDDLRVIETKAQVEYKSATKRSIRLDIKAVDGTNKHFDIEIQRADSGADAKRARFHGSMFDRELLEKNQDFKELPESFIIFITEMISTSVAYRYIILNGRSRKGNMSYLEMVYISYM